MGRKYSESRKDSILSQNCISEFPLEKVKSICEKYIGLFNIKQINNPIKDTRFKGDENHTLSQLNKLYEEDVLKSLFSVFNVV